MQNFVQDVLICKIILAMLVGRLTAEIRVCRRKISAEPSFGEDQQQEQVKLIGESLRKFPRSINPLTENFFVQQTMVSFFTNIFDLVHERPSSGIYNRFLINDYPAKKEKEPKRLDMYIVQCILKEVLFFLQSVARAKAKAATVAIKSPRQTCPRPVARHVPQF